MNLGPSHDQQLSGKKLAKLAGAEPAKKGLGGKALSSGKGLAGGLGEGTGESAGASSGASSGTKAAPVTSAPTEPLAFEFEDSAPSPAKPKKSVAEPAPSFNPFDDMTPAGHAAMVQPTSAPAPATNRVVKPETKSVAKPGTGRTDKPATGRTEKPGTGRTTNPSYDENNDFAQGTAKDLWTCPHCGAKNKPQRENCRGCGKHPDDPVEKPWYVKPLIVGPVVVGIIGVIMLMMWLTSVDMSMKPAGIMDHAARVKSVSENIVDLGDSRKLFVRKTASVSGRVIMVGQYPMAPWMTAVALALGDKAKDDETFGKWSASFSDMGMDINAPKSTALYLIFSGQPEEIKAGDYISVRGKAGIPEQDAIIVRGTDDRNALVIKVEQFQKR
jgi:hypothetical protein